jgi:cyclic beta-1,2-glucan synthetase
MGCGDWNDGMNRVGHLGRGESVWLGWFLCGLVQAWLPLARQRGDGVRVKRWNTAALGWRGALQTEAWDGAWFKRAFFDDGSPLGSNTNTEARLDLIAQAWAVLSGVATEQHQVEAMRAVHTHLVDADNGLIRLLDPPLVQATPRAGYIQSYPPGVRENGGQYNHAAVWALMAQAQLMRDLAQDDPRRNIPYDYFTYISAAHRASHARRGAAYGLEPYVLAGDVCSHQPYVGRGGWSWYTGAAGWLHRAAAESIFGLTLRAHCLSLAPCLPLHWPVAELTLRRGDQVLHLVVVRANADTALQAARLLTNIGSAQLLLVQQNLDWRAWPGESCWVVPLLAQKE